MIYFCTYKIVNFFVVTLIPGLISGIGVYWVGILRENKAELLRVKNLKSGVSSEMKSNLEFAKHNVSVADRKINESANSLNLIFFKNAAAVNLLSYSNIEMDATSMEKLRHYIVVVEHVNSIATDYSQTLSPNIGKELIKYCSQDSEVASLPKVISNITLK